VTKRTSTIYNELVLLLENPESAKAWKPSKAK
jgi:hypothetical protein